MQSKGRVVLLFAAIAAFAVLLAAVGARGFPATVATPFPAVPPLPTPSLPPLVLQVSPLGSVDTLAQIRIRFAEPIVPLEAIDSPDEQRKLTFFHITPNVPGHFHFITPRLVGFQLDRELPQATRFRVTVSRGLASVAGHKLFKDIAYTFELQPISLSLPSGDHYTLTPDLQLSSSVELNLSTLQTRFSMKDDRTGSVVPTTISLASPGYQWGPSAQPTTDINDNTWWSYRISLGSTLRKATQYDFAVAPGVQARWGNIPTSDSLTSGIETFEPLRFSGLVQNSDGDQLFQSGVPSLTFNNAITAASALIGIHLSAAGMPVVQDGGETIAIPQELVRPDTAYVVTLDPGLTDVYGQSLGAPAQARFSIGDYSADLWVPGVQDQGWLHSDDSGQDQPFAIIARQSDLALRLWAINLPTRTFQASYRRMDPQDLVYFDNPLPSRSDPRQIFARDLLPLTGAWQTYPAPYVRNQPVSTALPLHALLAGETGLLAYGAQAETYRYREGSQWRYATPAFYGMVQRTNLGIFVQALPTGAVVLVDALSDGAPVARADVEFFVRHLGARERPQEQPCVSGQTDDAGALLLSQAQFSPCLDQHGEIASGLLVTARSAQDWAFTTLCCADGWNPKEVQSRSALFPDRDLYQPGETATLFGAAFFWQDDRMKRDSGSRYDLTLTDPDGATTKIGEKSTDAFGLFVDRVPLARDAKPGYYQVSAASSNGNTMSARFRIAEFTAPAFALDMSVDKGIAAAGETVLAQGEATYLFGAPLSGGKSTWFVTRQRWYPRWSDWLMRKWEGYSFGRLWIPPEITPTVSTRVFNRSGSFDKLGRVRQPIAIEKPLPFWLSYTVELQASDATNRSVAQTATFNVVPAPEVIGVNGPENAVSGQPATYNVVVTDRNGDALPGRDVVATLELQHVGQNNAVTYEPVDSTNVTSAKQPVDATLTPRSPGQYRVRADFRAAPTSDAQTDRAVWVTPIPSPTPPPPPTPAPTPTEAPMNIEWAPTASPRPGDVVQVTVELPYQDADLYAVVARRTVYARVHERVVGGSARFDFVVTPEMAPDVSILAHAVRRDSPHNGVTAQTGQTLSSSASASIPLDLSGRVLNASVSADRTELDPGAVQTLHFRLRDFRGRPVPGEFAVAVVDTSILQLTRYKPPDLFETLYAEGFGALELDDDNNRYVMLQEPQQQLLARFGFGRPESRQGSLVAPHVEADEYSINSANTASPVIKTLGAISMRSGQSALQPPLVRKNFSVAAFAGLVRTDAFGNAKLSFKVPDSLTKWQVFAEVFGAPQTTPAGEDLRFGYTETTFVTRKRLALQPLLPQFARPDDLLMLGVNVTNDTRGSGILKLLGVLNGPIAFSAGSSTSKSRAFTTRAAPGTVGHRFAAKATAWGTGTVRFEGWLNGDSDGFQMPLPVLPLDVTEHVVDSGTTLANTTIPLRVDPHVDDRVGGLTITLASTLLPEVTVPATQVFDGIDIPLLEPSASRLLIATELIVLDRKFKRPVVSYDPMAVAATQLDHLVELQNEDGGFSYWPQSPRSDPWDSAYAAEALGKAVGAGIPVSPSMVNGVQRYLDAVVDNPANYCYLCPNEWLQRLRLEAMIGLQSIGELRTSALSDVWAVRDDFGLMGQVKLARLASVVPGWQAQARSLTAEVQQYVYESGRNATVNVPQYWWWFDSVTCLQSQMLRLFVAQRIDPEIVDRLVRGLLGRERNGAWQNQFDTAQAIEALVAYAQLEPLPPNFFASARLSGVQVAATRFVGYAHTSGEFTVPMARLPRERSDLILAKNGTGRLHYVVDYGYRVRGAQKGQSAGLRIERIVHPANENAVLADVALTAPQTPALLATGEVYDITLRVTVDHPVDHVLVTDPLPGGLEAVDQSFLTTTRHYQPAGFSWVFNYQTIYRDRVVLYADQLGPGVYDVHYLARSVTPGTFLWPGANAYLIYAPEEFGRTASSTLVVFGN